MRQHTGHGALGVAAAMVLGLWSCVPQLAEVPCVRDENCPGMATCLCGVCVDADAGRPPGCPAAGGSAAGGRAGGAAGGATSGGSAGGVAGGAVGGGSVGGGSVGGGSVGGGSVGGGSVGGGSVGGGSVGGGSVGGGSVGGGAGGGCTPRTCSDYGASCGSPPDQCGGTLSCGSCTAPSTCSPMYRCQTPEEQLRAVQSAADGIVGGGPAAVDLPVNNVVVTAIKPSVSGASTFTDSPGFFVQSGTAGLFVETMVVPTPIPGDRVSFRVTQVARENFMRKAKALSNYQLVSVSNPLPGATEVGALDLSQPNVRSTYESTLVALTMRAVSGNSFDGGTRDYGTVAFSALPAATLRMPATLDATEDLRAGCSVNATGPLWFTAPTGGHVSVWEPSRLMGSSCLPPVFVDAGSPTQTTVLLTTSRYMSPATPSSFRVLERGGTLTATIGGVSQPSPQVFSLNGAMQLGREYDVQVGSPAPADTRGQPVPAGPGVSFVAGGCQSTTPIIISAVSVGAMTDYVELHNRTSMGISLGGWRLVWVFSSGNGGTLNLSGNLPPGGYFLVATSGGDQMLPPNFDTTGGWIGLTTSGVTGCNPTLMQDWMAWGNNSCVSSFLPGGFTGYRRNDVHGCLDANVVNDWSTTLGTPRRAATVPQTCLCP